MRAGRFAGWAAVLMAVAWLSVDVLGPVSIRGDAPDEPAEEAPAGAVLADSPASGSDARQLAAELLSDQTGVADNIKEIEVNGSSLAIFVYMPNDSVTLPLCAFGKTYAGYHREELDYFAVMDGSKVLCDGSATSLRTIPQD